MTVVAVSDAWIGVIGALGGVAITGLIGLVTAVLNHRWSSQVAEKARRSELLGKRAELRREAYARYLVASQVVGDELVTWEPPDHSRSPGELIFDFRRAKPETAVEYDSSLRHAKLVASEAVVDALVTYNQWIVDQAGQVAEAWHQRSQPNAFDDWDDVEKPLLDAMRAEQEADLTR